MSTPPVHMFALPRRITRLGDLAYNLWWFWDPAAKWLFRDLDPVLWDASAESPVLFLQKIDPVKLLHAAESEEYVAALDAAMARYDEMIQRAPADTWVGKNAPQLVDKTIGYFSAEFGLHRALPIYSGGLGVLAGDHIKEASDLGLPLVAVSLLYRQGYLHQHLNAEGWQLDVTAPLDPAAEPTTQEFDRNGKPLLVEITFGNPDQPVRLAIWRVRVGRVPLFLLDADVEGNPDWTRTISSRLYGGDIEHRLRQEIILGIGGVRALKALGIQPDAWHANEGHAAFHLLERVRQHVEEGLTFDEAVGRIRATTVFTSHTPVPAGHDVFPPQMVDQYFAHYWPRLGLDREQFHALGRTPEHGDGFNLTALSMRLANQLNGVSERHGEVTREMWHDLWPDKPVDEVPITSITNGVHLPTWVRPRLQYAFDHYLPGWRDNQEDPAFWEAIHTIPDDEFWQLHLAIKDDLLSLIRERGRRRWAAGDVDPGQALTVGPFLEKDVLTIGFARRFATYKRATLLFHDADRLAKILTNRERPVQMIFAGKAHPADDGGKRFIQEIFWRTRDPKFGGRIAFAEDYDMGLASRLVAGVDVWLNNPRAPLEASGTSGMKAGANGVPNLSILDGWWIEGWEPGNGNGWGIEPAPGNEAEQNAAEAEALYRTIERSVVPLYYQRDKQGVPRGWVQMQKESIRTVAPQFSARRMVIDYIRKLYTPAVHALQPAER